MNPLVRAGRDLGRGFKSFGMRWSGQGGGQTPVSAIFRLGRTNFNYYTDVTDGRGNSIVMSCVLWICRNFPQAPLQVVQVNDDGTYNPQPKHELLAAIKNPNPFYSDDVLWHATLADLTVSGNAYWLIAKGVYNTLGELWWTPSSMMRPRWNENGGKYIDWYDYTPDPSKSNEVYKLKPEEVVHFRYGLDPDNTRLGMSPLASLLREIWTDDEAANFSASLLRNLGVPGVIIAPDDADTEITAEDADAMKLNYMDRFGGDNRGEPMVVSAKVKVQVLSFSPEQMNLMSMRRVPEERVTAVLGVNAIVAGLGAGLQASTFRNYTEARKAAYQENIIPMQNIVASEIKRSLLPLTAGADNLDIAFDTSRLDVFIDAQRQRANFANQIVIGGWITVGQGMRMIGLPAGPEYDYYLRKTGTAPVPLADAGDPEKAAGMHPAMAAQLGNTDNLGDNLGKPPTQIPAKAPAKPVVPAKEDAAA